MQNMHKQRIALLVVAIILIIMGLFVTMATNLPNPGDNFRNYHFAIVGLITGVLALIGTREAALPIWSKIIITVANFTQQYLVTKCHLLLRRWLLKLTRQIQVTDLVKLPKLLVKQLSLLRILHLKRLAHQQLRP